MMRFLTFFLVLFASIEAIELKASRPSRGAPAAGDPAPAAGDPAPAAGDSLTDVLAKVDKKYDQLEDVNGTLFSMACRYKHENDLKGMAFENVKKGGGGSLEEAMKKLEGENLEEMRTNCGLMSAKGEKNCMTACSENNGKDVDAKQKCVDLCQKKFKTYDDECHTYVDGLQAAYAQSRGNMLVANDCLEVHCREFPHILSMKADKQKAEVEKSCSKQCGKGETGKEEKFKEREKKCMSKCEDGCDLGSLGACRAKFKGNPNAIKDYCDKLWKWMFKNEEVDYKTGNPVVFLE